MKVYNVRIGAAEDSNRIEVHNDNGKMVAASPAWTVELEMTGMAEHVASALRRYADTIDPPQMAMAKRGFGDLFTEAIEKGLRESEEKRD